MPSASAVSGVYIMTVSFGVLFKLVSIVVMTGCLCVLCVAALCEQVPSPSPTTAAAATAAPALLPSSPAAPPNAAGQPPSPGVSPVTQAAVQAGVLTSASRINQVVTFLTNGVESSAYLSVPTKQPDQGLFSVSLSLEGKGSQVAYASASVVPTPAGQVAAVYDHVQYVDKPAPEVEKTLFKDLKRKGEFGKQIIMLDSGNTTIFLMPAGSGCVVIKKQVIQ